MNIDFINAKIYHPYKKKELGKTIKPHYFLFSLPPFSSRAHQSVFCPRSNCPVKQTHYFIGSTLRTVYKNYIATHVVLLHLSRTRKTFSHEEGNMIHIYL